ncbi:hypothetical protein [Dehalobacter sp. CF]|jgi:hypothetical protein|uniref:hypothetical protein n=1 Tax=Dehalobacter sp. CF TaxID=1131462 RepID=UPI00028AF050|nr:hypothetical protein [Dehalobacter sp. CF]AFV05415.1 hypothetical protein DCF50_p1409 [Dehalobacter sp. CF]
MSDRIEKEMEYTLEKYKFVGDFLNQIDKLIDDKAPKDLIQAKYKELKEWSKLEYNKVSKYKHNDGYISQWYEPLITDIYVTSFDIAKTNSSIDKIKIAIIDGLSYFGHWNGMLKGYKKQEVD